MKDLEERNDTLCVYGCAIIFFGLDFQTRFKFILLDVTNKLNVYRPILVHKGDKIRFLTFMLKKHTKVRVSCFNSSFP